MIALAVGSSPVSAASSSAKDKTQSARHKTTQPAEAARPTAQPALAQISPAPSTAPVAASAPFNRDYTSSEVIFESVFGDVYADPSQWQELGLGNLFAKGWDKPWASPLAGGGGAPRQGWLKSYDGVFFRLSLATFNWQHGLANNSDGYGGTLTSYTPLNQRTEIRTDIGLTSNRGPTGGGDAQTNFGDFTVTHRFMLSESKEQSHVFEIGFRTPTGNSFNGNGVASINPTLDVGTASKNDSVFPILPKTHQGNCSGPYP